VHVVNLEVFSRREPVGRAFAWANMFHRTTRESVIAREALFRAGDRYDQTLVEETVRNLRGSGLSNVVVVLPVASAAPERVDVLIVTRDIWSLRLNTDFEFQQGHLVYLSTSLSENNLLGWRKTAALVLDMDQGAVRVGPSYVDPNIRGTRLTLSASARVHYRREGGGTEGSSSGLTVAYPLYQLASRWGGSFSVGHGDSVVRRFLETRLAPVDFTTTPAVHERWPWIYRVRRFAATTAGVRSFPGRVIQRVRFGHQYSVVRPSFTRDFPDDDEARAEFAREIFPRSERVSSLFVGYSLFTPQYRVLRNIDSFDLGEDVRVGPSLDASASRAFTALGSERDFSGLALSAAWALALGGGFQRASAGWSARLQDGALIDKALSAGVYAASPVIARALRLVGSLGANVLLDETQNRFYSLGGDTGLRAYVIGDLVGKSEFLGHAELRSLALRVFSLRVGGLLFYDVGDAATPAVDPGGGDLARALRSLAALTPHQDFGLGIRLLIPQLDAYVLRFDWAIATADTHYTRAGLPGRISLGFRQVF
jgi:hypothetical protein